MTTFKTFVMAAMMTVFGATATFANNNVLNHKNPYPPVRPAAMHNPHKHTPRGVCHCPQCEEARYRMEMERLHRVNRGPVRGCHCPKCENMRRQHKQMVPPPPPPHRHR